MPLDIPEILSDLPEAVALVQAVEGSLTKFKANPQTAGAICRFASEILAAAAPLADKIEAQAKT